MLLVSLRWLGATLLLLVFARRFVMRDWPRLRGHLPLLSAMGGLGFAVFNGLLYLGAHYTTAVNIGILQGAVPIFIIVGMYVAFRRPLIPRQITGVALTLAGVAVITSGGDLSRLLALSVNRGDLLILIAALLYAGYAIGLEKRPAVSSLGLFTVLAGAAFVASIPLTLAEAAMGLLQWPTATGWLIVVMVTLFPSFVAQVFFMRGVALIGPGRAGVFINLVPIFAALLAVLLLDETFQGFHALALVLVLGGIALAEQLGISRRR